MHRVLDDISSSRNPKAKEANVLLRRLSARDFVIKVLFCADLYSVLGKASEKLQRVDEPLWLKSEALQHAMEDMKERSTERIVDHGTLCSHIDDIRVSKFKGFAISSNVTGMHTR